MNVIPNPRYLTSLISCLIGLASIAIYFYGLEAMKNLFLILGLSVSASQAQFNNPPGVDAWCGKAYRATNASFDPGGWLDPPRKSAVPLLNLQVYPRMNVYLEDEVEAIMVVDAVVGYEVGVPYCVGNGDGDGFIAASEVTFKLEIEAQGSAMNTKEVVVGSTANQIPISIEGLPPSFEPYKVEITASTPQCSQTYSATTQIYRLPKRTDGGTVAKLDHLYGGLYVQNATTSPATWRAVFPYSFYVDWGGYLKYPGNQTAFAELGYNIVHPTPGGGDTPFEPDLFAAFMDKLDVLGQYLMYDMRWTFKNTTLVTQQINTFKTRKSILLWYTADEPDGQQDPLDSPLIAYKAIKKLDPYHPTSLVLNCGNFYFGEYTRGADIILTDPYPIAMNATWSNQWNTPCNTTYGDCGCDNCNGNFEDISTRMENLKNYQSWLSNAPRGKSQQAGPPKTFWGVPQVFGGSEYWARPPTAKEEVVMVWLFINHGAKGIVGWNFPTTKELTDVSSAMAKVVTGEEVTRLLLGDNPRVLVVQGGGVGIVDASAWIVGGKMLVSVVYMGLEDTESEVVVNLPKSVKEGSVKQVWPVVDVGARRLVEELKTQEEALPWPEDRMSNTWHVKDSVARRKGIPAMMVSIMVMDIE